MAESAVRLVVAYPEVLGTYGDNGNATVLAQRLRWRGESVERVDVPLSDPLPGDGDLYVLGGGEDDAQVLAAQRLRAGGVLAKAVGRGAVVFGVCAGLQLLGRTFLRGDGRAEPGAGVLDAVSDRKPGARAVGEIVARPHLDGLPVLTGYENHGGRTILGPDAAPLATVEAGVGNGTDDRAEGAVAGRILCTYLHGPVLARNPALADLLLGWVLGRPLPPLDDDEVEVLRRERLAAVRR